MITGENRILILNFFISSLKLYSYWFILYCLRHLTNCNQLQELSEEKLSWFSENRTSKCVCANKVLVKFFERFVLLILKTLVCSNFRLKASPLNWTEIKSCKKVSNEKWNNEDFHYYKLKTTVYICYYTSKLG